jgi:Galactose oxidase, central domain
MSADRFEQDLRAVLREAAPDGAPLALRLRVADVAARPTPAAASGAVRLPRLAWVLLAAALLVSLLAATAFVGARRPDQAVVIAPSPSLSPSPAPVAVCPPGSTPDEAGPVDQVRPPAGIMFRLAFDRDSAKIVALAGQVLGGPSTWETWTFDVCTNTWQRMSPPAVPSLVGGIAYDAVADRTIVIGEGMRPWAYDLRADTWTQWSAPRAGGPADPAAMAGFRLAYDPASGLVYALDIQAEAAPMALWTYDVESDAWTPVAQRGDLPSPSQRDHLLLAYDSAVDEFVAVLATGVGGYTRSFDPRAGTWTLADTRTPSVNTGYVASGGEIAYDEATGRTVVFSDGFVGAYDAGPDRWEALYGNEAGVQPGYGPQWRLSHWMVYDPVNARLVIAGGVVRTEDAVGVPTDDVWAFDTVTRQWTELLAPSQPGATRQ